MTRGDRLASFFWVESMVRSDEQRRLLYEMDRHLMRLRSSVGETEPAVIGLTGTYHNLLRAVGRRLRRARAKEPPMKPCLLALP